ncbi:hypothetical protein PpBr36_02251 [Pyricularia pennisetigena]|uniref:hypothetical protein n=1 Tax=Pyricularia pennisetigena TaxID=1578925 RepID=UPI001151A99A|nr:hypothetical protein PpBr36_02251 [Pyricularia pennisetigena]TLS30946.1 hypothetical protein PpBr36_02251 [Pyricularia pennisetigena]
MQTDQILRWLFVASTDSLLIHPIEKACKWRRTYLNSPNTSDSDIETPPPNKRNQLKSKREVQYDGLFFREIVLCDPPAQVKRLIHEVERGIDDVFEALGRKWLPPSVPNGKMVDFCFAIDPRSSDLEHDAAAKMTAIDAL